MRLAQSHAAAVGGDTLVAMALAGTLFFSVPSTEARENVALYLLLTLAPFAVLGPFLGRLYERFPGAYRGGLVISSALRAVLAIVMVFTITSLALFPLAFALLVLSRFHGISRSSVLPVLMDRSVELVAANAELARLGILGSAVAVPLGGLALWLDLPVIGLLLAAGMFVWSALAARALPPMDLTAIARHGPAAGGRVTTPQSVRLARFATAAVRFLNGFLLLLVAFAFSDTDAGFADFGALLGAAGAGYLAAAFLTPWLERRISEEPMVVTALAVEAGAAFLAAQWFGLPAAAALAAVAGLAWGVAKFGFDGLLQSTVPIEGRGRAFTNSETMFQVAWVLGALIPVLPVIPIELGLVVAGLAALVIQVIYVSATLVPVAAARRRAVRQREEAEAAARASAAAADPLGGDAAGGDLPPATTPDQQGNEGSNLLDLF
jgi:hypothetical protein